MKDLSPKQERFCEEYIKDLHGTNAAIRAGYSESSATQQASRLLTKENVHARIVELKAQRSKETLVDAEFVVLGLKEMVFRCMQKKPVLEFDYLEKRLTHKMVETEEGKEVGAYEFDSHGANKALELLGKHVGLFDKKKDDTDNRAVQVVVKAPDNSVSIGLASDESQISLEKDERYKRPN